MTRHDGLKSNTDFVRISTVTELESPRRDGREVEPTSPRIILVDQDDVLADFEGEWIRRWQEIHPDLPFVPREQRAAFYVADDYPEHLREMVRAIHNSPGFIASLPPMPGAIEALAEMREAGFIVKICTSPLIRNRDALTEKHDWVERHLGLEWLRHLVITSDKTIVDGDYLIDDRPKVEGIRKPRWQHIVFTQSYNLSVPEPRINNWSEWRQVLSTLEAAKT